jgi:flagellar basal-body rod protein FlgF
VLQGGRAIDIGADGTIRQEGADAGRLEIVEFASAAGIAKHGNNFFRVSDPALSPAVASASTVEQGKLESSNTGSAESAVRLVSVMRQFEMLQKAVNLGGEMNRAAIEQVARVGN